MAYEPLTQIDTPCISFCQSSDCSGITMNFGTNDYFPFYNITSVSLQVTCGAYTSGTVDITPSIVETITGTTTMSDMSHAILGIGTLFTTELSVGDYIVNSANPWYLHRVYEINSNTNLDTVNIGYYNNAGIYYASRKVNTSYLITPSFIGMTTSVVPDGAYTAVVTIVADIDGAPQTFVVSTDFAITCNNFCCLYEKLAEFADMCDDCMTNENIKKILDAMMAWGLLEAYMAAPYCGDTVSFATLNAKLTELCNSTPCKNC